jgi:phosphopantetheinyl transferase (holo-ACP synthase)
MIGRQSPIAVNAFDFSEVQVRKDAYQRPFIELSGEVRAQFEASLPNNARADISTSISHDGAFATAVCSICLQPQSN